MMMRPWRTFHVHFDGAYLGNEYDGWRNIRLYSNRKSLVSLSTRGFPMSCIFDANVRRQIISVAHSVQRIYDERANINARRLTLWHTGVKFDEV